MSEEGGDVGSVDLGEKGYSYKETVLRALQRASDSLSVEFRGGYYRESGYEPDSREIACSHVWVLAVLLRYKFDGEACKDWKLFNSKLDGLRADFIKNSKARDSVVMGSDYYVEESDRVLLEELKFKKLALHKDLFEKMNLLLGRKKWLEMGGGTY